MKERLHMYDETKGTVREIYIHVTPVSLPFAREALNLFGSARFYFAREPTEEELKDKILHGFSDKPEIDRRFMEFMQRFCSLDFEYTQKLFCPKDDVAKLIADSWEKEDSRELKDVLEVYEFYKQNPLFREFVEAYIEYCTSKNLGFNQANVEAFQREIGTRGIVFPANGSITSFSRDRFIPAIDSSGRKVIVQGKTLEGMLNLGPRSRVNELEIVKQGIWVRNGFRTIPASRTGLVYYDGGDIITTKYTAFVGPDVYLKNVSELGAPQTKMCLENLTGKRIVVVANHIDTWSHIDLYWIPLDERSGLLGDPSLCKKVLSPKGLWNEDYERSLRVLGPELDLVAEGLIREGLQVSRIPLICLGSQITERHIKANYITRSYANAVIDNQDVSVAPFGIDELDELSRKPFEERGLRIKTVKSMGTIPNLLDKSKLGIMEYRNAGVRCSTCVLSRG